MYATLKGFTALMSPSDTTVPPSAVTAGTGSNANNIRNALKQYVYEHQ